MTLMRTEREATFEGGLMAAQLLRSFRLFVEVTRRAVQVMVPDELR